MISMGKYIYCIIATDEAKHFGPIGISGSDVHNISYNGLSAVVSNVLLTKYELSPEMLTTHHRVIEQVMKDYTVLPVRFCTVAESATDILQFLTLHSRKFWCLFDELESKVEIGIEVFWKDMKKIFEEIVTNNPQLKQKGLQHQNLQKDQLIETGKEVAKIIEQKKEEVANEWLINLKKLSYDYKGLKCRTDNMVFNVAFLVSDMKQREFDSIVEKMANENSQDWDVKYIGPTPPYNFVNIELNLYGGNSLRGEKW